MRRRQSLVLLAVSIVVLIAGALVRRRVPAPAPPPEVPDLERLQRLTAERRLRDLSGYLQDIARAASPRLLSPSALAWDTTLVLAAPAPLERYTVAEVAGGGRPVSLVRAPSPTGVPFSIWHAPAASGLPRASSVVPKRGDWLLAAARVGAGDPAYAHGLFQGIQKQTCGAFEYEALAFDAALSPILIGGGVFALDGGVAGFIGACEGRPIPIAASTIAAVLARPVSPAEWLEQRQGYRLSDDVVSSVWENSAAAAAGLQPGDVVDPSVERPAVAKRRGRTVQLEWPTGDAPLPTILGITLNGATVAAIESGSPGAAAGLAPGDTIVRPANPGRALDRAKAPIVLTVERGGRRLETLLRP